MPKTYIMLDILKKVSALYQLNIISANQKNELVRLAQKGRSGDFNELYSYASKISHGREAIEDLKRIITMSQ